MAKNDLRRASRDRVIARRLAFVQAAWISSYDVGRNGALASSERWCGYRAWRGRYDKWNLVCDCGHRMYPDNEVGARWRWDRLVPDAGWDEVRPEVRRPKAAYVSGAYRRGA